MKKNIIMTAMAAVAIPLALLCSCSGDEYVAKVTELKLVSVNPTNGYPGEIVRILGRNFSPVASQNKVVIAGEEARILECGRDELQIILPEAEPGDYTLTVTSPAGTAGGLSFTYLKVPDHQYLVTTIVGQKGAYEMVDGIGTAAITKLPTGLNKAPDGSIWFTCRGYNKIRRIAKDYTVTTLADVELGSSAIWQGCFSPDGQYYYFVDKPKGMLRRMSVSDYSVTTVASGLKSPMNCCFDADGNVYVSARDNKAIYKFDKDNVKTTFATLDAGPNYCKFAPNGNLIVTLNSGYKFVSISPDGTVTDFLGTGVKPEEKSDGEPGQPLTVGIKTCFGFDFDSNGVMYISDNSYNCIRRFTPGPGLDYSTGTVETIIGSVSGYADGSGLKVKMSQPYEIMVYDDNTLYFADTVNYLIRKVVIK